MVVNTLSPSEKQERLAAIDARMHSILQAKRDQWNGEAYLIQVKVSSYFSKVDTSGTTALKVSNWRTISIYVGLALAFSTSIVVAYFQQFYAMPILFVPIAALIVYKTNKVGKNNIIASPTTLDINGKNMLWQDVFKCYIIHMFEGKEEQQLLYVFDEDGVPSIHYISGIDKYKVGHLVASYQQAYHKDVV